MAHRIAIILRRTVGTNRFRSFLQGCVALPQLSEAVVASGFFQEDAKFSGASLLVPKSHTCISRRDIVLVGVYNRFWMGGFNSLASEVARLSCASCTTVKKRVPKGLRWHAKTFIGSFAGKPRVGIVGSSNLTRPAADLSAPFNFEADVLMWYDSDQDVNALALAEIEQAGGSHEFISATYDEGGLNGGLDISERLAHIRSEILEGSHEV